MYRCQIVTARKKTSREKPAPTRELGEGIIDFGDREREQIKIINRRFEQNYLAERRASHESKSAIEKMGLAEIITEGIAAGIEPLRKLVESRSDVRRRNLAEKDRREAERLLKARTSPSLQNFAHVLTDKEWDVARLLWDHDWSQARIARAMGRDRKTIIETIARAKRKIGHTRQNAKARDRMPHD